MTEEECTALFDQDLAKVMQNLQPTISGFRYMSDCHRAALINLCFNLGISGLGKFTKMLNAIQKGDGEEAAEQLMNSKYATQVPKRAKRVCMLLKGQIPKEYL